MTSPTESLHSAPGIQEQYVPPLIEGESILTTVDYYNREEKLGLLYRGAADALPLITTNVPYCGFEGMRLPDSDYAVVCASPDPLIACFMALQPPGHWKAYEATDDGVSDFLRNQQR